MHIRCCCCLFLFMKNDGLSLLRAIFHKNQIINGSTVLIHKTLPTANCWQIGKYYNTLAGSELFLSLKWKANYSTLPFYNIISIREKKLPGMFSKMLCCTYSIFFLLAGTISNSSKGMPVKGHSDRSLSSIHHASSGTDSLKQMPTSPQR